MKYNKKIIRVKANDNQIKKMYAKFSKFYAYIEKSERKLRKRALELLETQDNEIILEIGFGRGTNSIEIAKYLGKNGKVYEIDLTPEMVTLAKKRVALEGLSRKINLQQGDARSLPYEDKLFDVVYITSTLELFDTPDLPIVLNEIKRV
ncbi:MAG: class I SAM-dependent methyltransferase, partial [Candidatus Hermodarchaeota archaeon]